MSRANFDFVLTFVSFNQTIRKMIKSIPPSATIPDAIGTLPQTKNPMRSINENAPVKCSKTITIHADRKRVWAVLTTIDAWATWQTDIKKPKRHGELKAGTTFDWSTGGVKIHSTLHTIEPYQKFGWTGKTFGMMAIHNWELTEANGKTTIEVHESMEGLLARLFKKSFNKDLERGMILWLALLKKECEKL